MSLIQQRSRSGVLRVGQLPYVVLAISIALCAAVGLVFHVAVRDRDESRFQNAIHATEDRIQNRLDAYVAALVVTRGLLNVHGGTIDAPSFRAFVEELDVNRRYPGIQGIGFARAFSSAEREAVEAEARRGGFADFHVWPDGPREQLHAIVLLEPLDRRNRAAIGYDMFTEAVRREAMIRARDTGEPAASGPVTLVQEIDEKKQVGFLVYLPVYWGGRVPATVEERRAALAGFVYSPFRMDDLLHGIFGSKAEPRLGFEVRDRDAPEILLHGSGSADRHPVVSATSTLHVAGRTWSLAYWSLPPFEVGSSRWLWPYLLLAGVGATGMLFALSRWQARAAEQLRVHAQVLDSMSEGVSISDENGRIVYTNPAEDAMFGYEHGELVGRSMTAQNTYDATENQRLATEVAEAIRTNGVWVGELDNVKKDGTRFVTSAHVTAPSIGGRRHWVCVQQDITDKKRAETERAARLETERALRAEAEAASRTKDEFLAMLGHELRNPLAPIVTALALLERREGLSGARELEIVVRQVKHLRRLVDDLLDVSAITRGKVKLERSRVDVAAAIERALDIVRPLVDERRQRLHVEIRPGTYVDADEARLVQIVGNLLKNAAKYTQAGGRIEVSAAREGAHVAIRVRDDGQGIAQDSLERLFGLFEQGERGVDRAQGGLGIGLAVVRSLVHLHGGTVEGKSDGVGKGTEFTVRLPAAGAEAETAASPEASAKRRRRPSARRVLVVDDNTDAADMLGELMRLTGHDVAVAYDAKEALKLASEQAYDVAVLDIGLPDTDGYELASRLSDGGSPTLIAVTGYGQEHDRRLTREAGFAHHLVKPVDTKLLLALVDAAPTGRRESSRRIAPPRSDGAARAPKS